MYNITTKKEQQQTTKTTISTIHLSTHRNKYNKKNYEEITFSTPEKNEAFWSYNYICIPCIYWYCWDGFPLTLAIFQF